MFSAEYEGVNSFLVKASLLLLKEGVNRNTRGHKCWELPGPFIFKITNPTARIVTIKERKWNPILPFAESLWLASGRNDLEFIGHYLKNMKNFSDDGEYLRGGYGPRLRRFNGIAQDYKIGTASTNFSDINYLEVDQFTYVIESFNRDKNTRQAIINIGDPAKDCYDFKGLIKVTKDLPCTRLLHFMKDSTEEKLNLTVYMRSNDFLWGASAVNIFNYTFMLEYFAHILNLDIGSYYHIANNFHYYEKHKDHIEEISKVKDFVDIPYKYELSFKNIVEFDNLVSKLSQEEEILRAGKRSTSVNFEDDFFNDWYKTFYAFNTKSKVSFKNPILNDIFDWR